MTPQQGRGVQVLSQMVKQLTRMNPEAASIILDDFDDEELADVLSACSAARVAQEGEIARDVFDECVARRLAPSAGVPS